MQCSQCGQQNTVTVDGKTYCGNCGYQKTTHVLNLGQDKPDSTEAKPAGGNVLDLSEIPDKPAPIQIDTPAAVQIDTPEESRSIPSHHLHSHTNQSVEPAESESQPETEPETNQPQEPAQPEPAEDRLTRASKVEKSAHISRFGTLHQQAEEPAEEPEEEPEIPPEPTKVPAQPKTNVGDEIARRHVRAPQSAASQQTADLSHLATSSTPDTTAQPTEEPSGPPLPIEEPEEPAEPGLFKRLFKRPRLSSATAAVISILLLAGYVTYLNFPNIALRVAASEAGFSARMPRYMPNQFDFTGPVAYGPGQIVVNFSGEEGQNVAITQRETDLDSQSLLENHIEAESTKPPLTFHERGLTIYVFNGNKASWVNRGIWYTIEGDHSLNAEQVIRIATSL